MGGVRVFGIYANASYVKRVDNEMLTSGQYGVTEMQCTFDDTWNGLDKWAVFTVPGISAPIKSKIINDSCRVPVEVFAQPGPVLVGAYGELVNDGVLVKRLSPAPVSVMIRQGSYRDDATESEVVTINEWFAKQAAEAKKAADAAIRAAKIANELVNGLKQTEKEENTDE
jgi:hypothetical protein